MASTNVAGSKGARSSGPSPSPTSFTGTPSSRWTATTMPPLAVPSSLVRMIPVMSTASANTRAWRRPFCPVVASSTSRTSSTEACLSITRLILPSSSISPALVCSRPAVSTMTVSVCSLIPSRTASNATLAGSAPSRSDPQAPVLVGADRLDEVRPQQRLDRVAAGAFHLDLGPQLVDELPGWRDADVGGDQCVLDLLPRLVVQAVTGQ